MTGWFLDFVFCLDTIVYKFHQMFFLTRLQSVADHRISHTEANPAFTNPEIRLRTNFNLGFNTAQTLSWICKLSTSTEYTITVSINNGAQLTKTKLWTGVCVVKPEWGQAVITDSGVSQGSQWKHFHTFPVILRLVSKNSNDQKLNQNKKIQAHFQEE